jgi:hypothetical protein
VPIRHPSSQANRNRSLWITSPEGSSNADHVRISDLIGETVPLFFIFIIRPIAIGNVNMTELLHTLMDAAWLLLRRTAVTVSWPKLVERWWCCAKAHYFMNPFTTSRENHIPAMLVCEAITFQPSSNFWTFILLFPTKGCFKLGKE